MTNFPSPERELLKTVLEPLLEDFSYWFTNAQNLLESEELTFLSEQEHSQLLQRVKQSQQEVATAKMLFHATNGQVGIEAAMLMPWHQLVAECWQISSKWRSLKNPL
ncbi:MAG: hypothetical protein RLZZ148_1792 [Cyanobacteriota bacterium]|jgi:hypothetical protein